MFELENSQIKECASVAHDDHKENTLGVVVVSSSGEEVEGGEIRVGNGGQAGIIRLIISFHNKT